MRLQMELIHYGADKYDPALFRTPHDTERMLNKPSGGLWASPVNSDYGWKEWSDAEQWGDTSCHFLLGFSGNALVIDSLADLDQFIWEPTPYWHKPCFKNVLAEYDAIYLTQKGEQETRFSLPKSLYGWDCESVLILNKDSIIIN